MNEANLFQRPLFVTPTKVGVQLERI